MLDGTVVNLALPSIAEDLDASFSQLQWIVNGYTLSLAALILLGGSLGDRHRPATRSSWSARSGSRSPRSCALLAPSAELLIAARVLQGIGGALLTPGSLAIIQSSFVASEPPTSDRRLVRSRRCRHGDRAVPRRLARRRGDVAIGVPDQRSARRRRGDDRVAPRSRESRITESSGRLDVPAPCSAPPLSPAITYGLTAQLWLICGDRCGVGVIFVVFELRGRAPMVPMHIFRSAQFSATNVVTFLLYGAFAAALFMLGLVLQGPLDYSPLLAGAATVPLTIMMLLFSARAGALAQRIGPRIPMTVGPLLCAVGLALLTLVEPGRSYFEAVLPGMLVFAIGLTFTVAPLTTTALSSVSAHLAGIASGVNNAVARTGSLVAVAAIPVVAGFAAGEAVDDATLLDGYGNVLWVSAGFAVAAALVSAIWIRRIEPEAPPAAPPPFHCAVSGPPVAVTAG